MSSNYKGGEKKSLTTNFSYIYCFSSEIYIINCPLLLINTQKKKNLFEKSKNNQTRSDSKRQIKERIKDAVG